jgi:hypothetical protein
METLKIGKLKNIVGGTVSREQVSSMDPIHVFNTSLDTVKYTDITNPISWMTIGLYKYDYLFCRAQTINWLQSNPWSGCSLEEKKYAAEHFCVGASDRAEVFTDAESELHWNNFVESAQSTRHNRWKQGKGYISYVLPLVDSLDMAEKTNDLSNLYIIYGVESNSLDGKDGLYDWVEGTSSYSGGTGFSGQSYWTQEYQDNLSSILRKGFK